MALVELTDLGKITITERTIEEIAGYAATHCYGVVGMCEKNTADFLRKVFKNDNIRKGIKATCVNDEISIDIHIKVSYGVNLKALSENVRQDITYAIGKMTKFAIKTINVCIDDIVVTKA